MAAGTVYNPVIPPPFSYRIRLFRDCPVGEGFSGVGGLRRLSLRYEGPEPPSPLPWPSRTDGMQPQKQSTASRNPFTFTFPSAVPCKILSLYHLQHLIHNRHQRLAQSGGLSVRILQGAALDSVVELDLGLCAGRSHADPCAVVQIVVQNVGGGKASTRPFSIFLFS